MNDIEEFFDIILITYYGTSVYEEVSETYEDIDDARADAIHYSESGNYDRVILRHIFYDNDYEDIEIIYEWRKDND